jgi:hypothetical protein
LQKERISYVVALKKNSSLVPLEFKMTGVFEYCGCNVACCKLPWGEFGFVYLFEDPELRVKVESGLLKKVGEGVFGMDEFYSRRLAGVFGVVSDLDVESWVVYMQYKEREEVEQVFDVLKNDLEADKTFLV